MIHRYLDDLENAIVVPAYGLENLKQYYMEDTANMHNVSSPLLCITTKSDPMVDNSMLSIPIEAAKGNKHIVTVITEDGGHMGWVEHFSSSSSQVEFQWYIRLFFEYIEAVTDKDMETA